MILAIDPGLGEMGWCVWRAPTVSPPTLQSYGACLVRLGTVRTRPSDALAARLAALGAAVRELIEGYPVRRVVVEAPAIEGRYAARRGGERVNARALRYHAQACGAILAAAWAPGRVVEELRADRLAKATRTEVLSRAVPALPRSSEHARDAAALGLRVLLAARGREAA